MAIKNDDLGGTDWIDVEILYSEDLNDTFDGTLVRDLKKLKLNRFGLDTNGENILAFSSTNWQSRDYDTSDGGATSSGGGYVAGRAFINRADKTKATMVSGTTFEYTIDSGSTWNAITTNPPNITSVKSVDYTHNDLICVAGEASSGAGLWYSTDDGDNFTQVSTPATGNFYGIGMHDTTHGIAISSNGSIWYTTNGTTWTDSTHDISITSNLNVIEVIVTSSGASITDFECLILQRDTSSNSGNSEIGRVEKYDGSGNPTQVLQHNGAPQQSTTTNFWKLTNGAILFIAESHSRGSQGILYVTDDVGITWYQIDLGSLFGGNAYDAFADLGDSLTEYDTNKILISVRHSDKLFQIDLNGL